MPAYDLPTVFPYVSRTRLSRRHFIVSALRTALPFVPISACRAEAVDDIVKTWMEQNHVSGMSLAVAQNGRVVLTQGYGLSDRESQRAATAATPYKIASVSKQFFASAILVLEQDGKLSVNDPVAKYLTDAPSTWQPITLRHLLSHTAGLVRESPAFNPQKVQPDSDVIRAAYPIPLVFTPGEKYQYSNVGYFTIADIIRIVSGKPWTQFIRERIFEPAGLRETRPTHFPISGRATGYTYKNNEWQKATEYLALRPSGAFVSTVEDMLRWDAALSTDKVLNPQSRRALWTPTPLNDGKTTPYGLGWSLSTVNGKKIAAHGGALPGFSSSYRHGLDESVSVVVLTNANGINAGTIGEAVASRFTGSS